MIRNMVWGAFWSVVLLDVRIARHTMRQLDYLHDRSRKLRRG